MQTDPITGVCADGITASPRRPRNTADIVFQSIQKLAATRMKIATSGLMNKPAKSQSQSKFISI
jgi:hypothetical protein